ncbi:hypothetical protein AWW66_17845 [Micromonospora rosaria]|uniref:Uncharacterized protein n=1 Tax=Micromonospora rosaria TaxID=47874 RepID=A0A136PQA6_9ACTN|nr:hypothetical protein AWW66_17845 [Micromonospora rosaria]
MATVGVAVASFAVAPPAAANDNGPVTMDEQVLREALFTMHMRGRMSGAEGYKDLMISYGMLAYRERNPQSTARQMIQHGVVLRNHYNSQLTANDLERPAFQFMMKLLELTAQVPGAGGASIVKDLLESTAGQQLQNYGSMVDQITAAQAHYSWHQHLHQTQNRIWQRVARVALVDSTFLEAWNSEFGVRYNVNPAGTTEDLSADPYVETWLNTNAILLNQHNDKKWLEEAMGQVTGLLTAINGRVDGYNEAVRQLAAQYPLTNGAPRPEPVAYQAAVQRASTAQDWIDGAAGALNVLAHLVGFADKRKGEIVAGVGRSAVQIATAINQYLPTIAGLGLSQALTSMSTLALTGNVLGAISALLPVFGGGNTPEQQILDELRSLRAEVGQLRENMNDRFDRIERGLTTMYTDMMNEFETIINLQRATDAQLTRINERLAGLTERVDMWGLTILRNQQQDVSGQIRSRINDVVGFKAETGLELPYHGDGENYASYARELREDARDRALNGPVVAPRTGITTADALTSYGTYGSIAHLLAQASAKGLPTQGVTAVRDAETWALAATGYQMLMAQNPEHAARLGTQVTAEVVSSGEQIQEAVRLFSAPREPVEGEPTPQYPFMNDYLHGLVMAYRITVVEMVKRMAEIRDEIRQGGKHDPFGLPEQPVPAGQKPTGDPATVPSCNSGPALSRPSDVEYADLEQALWVAQYGRSDSAITLCHESGWTNVSTHRSGKWEITRADLQFSFKARQKWDGNQRIIREWTKVIPLGEVCRTHDDGLPGACRQSSQDVAKWDSTYKAQFGNATFIDNEKAETDRAKKWLHQQGGDYYTKVHEELTNPHPQDPRTQTLYALNKKATEQARHYTAVVKLGFGTALSQDELMGLNLVGTNRAPYDLDGLNLITGPFEHARNNYCVADSNPCELKGTITKPLEGEKLLNCVHAVTLDPIAACIEGLMYYRTDILYERMNFWSEKIKNEEYVEGLPAVEAILQAVRTADTVARSTPVTP